MIIMHIDTPIDKLETNYLIIKGSILVIVITIIYSMFSWLINNYVYTKLK